MSFKRKIFRFFLKNLPVNKFFDHLLSFIQFTFIHKRLPSKKNLSSFTNSPLISLTRLDVRSSGAKSVKKPRLPKFTPNIGIPLYPYLPP